MRTIIVFLTTLMVTACASKPIARQWPNTNEMDPESGYTMAELRECAVIVESNQESCDPDGDLMNGDYDSAEVDMSL